MTRDELHRAANTPGFGTGKAIRDRLAAEAECRQLLPDPAWIPAAVAKRYDDTNASLRRLLCDFGNSGEDGQDWHIELHSQPYRLEGEALGHDAAEDAKIVAAILNAYRLGVLVIAPGPDSQRK